MCEPSDDIEPTRLVIKHLPTQAEIDAFVQAMDNYDAAMALARNMGTEILTEPTKMPNHNTDTEPVKCRRCGKPITGHAYYGPNGAECEECWHIVDTYVPTGKPCIKKRN